MSKELITVQVGLGSKGVANLAEVGAAGCKSRATLTASDHGREPLIDSLPQVPW